MNAIPGTPPFAPAGELDAEQLTGEDALHAGGEPADQGERPRRDKPPRARAKRTKGQRGSADGKPRGAVRKQQSARLEKALSDLLMFPAMPASMFAPDGESQAYMVEHFTRSGPRFATVLVEASESNDQLRALLERVTTGGSMFAVALAGAAYLAPPVLWALGDRERAMNLTMATTMDPAAAAEAAARMMGAHGPAPAHESAGPTEHQGPESPEGGPAAPGADPQHQ